MKYIILIIALLAMGCGKTDAERLEEEKWSQEYETEFQMSENKRLKAEIESNKLKAEKSNTSTNSPPQPTGQNSAKAKPVRKLTEEEKKVIGEYEYKDETHVFLENGKLEGYFNGKKMGELEWKLVGKEVYLFDEISSTVCKIEPNGDLTSIASIEFQKRTDYPKDKQITLKRIK